MFKLKMAIMRGLKSSFYKETAVFAVNVIDVNLLLIPCMFLCRWLLVPVHTPGAQEQVATYTNIHKG
jgi:hypothetical protein